MSTEEILGFWTMSMLTIVVIVEIIQVVKRG